METIKTDPVANLKEFKTGFKAALAAVQVSTERLSAFLGNPDQGAETTFDPEDTYPVQEKARVAATQSNFLN